MSINSEEGRNRILQECLTNLEECATLIGEYLSEDETDDQIAIIEQVAKEYHEDKMKRNISRAAIKLTEEYFDKENNEGIDIEEIYEENVRNSVTHIIPFEADPDMEKIMNALRNVSSVTGARQNANNSIVLTQVTQLPLDPITKTKMQDPWKNKVCGHLYEHNVIVSYIKSKKSKNIKCPYVGCGNTNIQISDLIKDETLSLAIRNNQENPALSNSIEEID